MAAKNVNMIKITNASGSVTISSDTIAAIAGAAASECYGIVAMSSKNVSDGLSDWFKKENLQKGIKVTITDEELSIELHVVVEYGVNISATAQNIIDTVKYMVENMTAKPVTKVNVIVDGIKVDK